MLISMIAAMARNRVIGRDGGMPWHLPGDLQRFKQLTMGAPLLMGRLTFESIGRPLPGRRMIVLSSNPAYSAQGCEVVGSIELGLQLAEPAEELFICGGAKVFRQTLAITERIYLTEIDEEFAGDSYFPELPAAAFHPLFTARYTEQLDYSLSVLQRPGVAVELSQEVKDTLCR